MTTTASTTVWLALCGCCTSHDPDPLVWECVPCLDCGQPCSCIGCAAEADAREFPGPQLIERPWRQLEEVRGEVRGEGAPEGGARQ